MGGGFIGRAEVAFELRHVVLPAFLVGLGVSVEIVIEKLCQCHCATLGASFGGWVAIIGNIAFASPSGRAPASMVMSGNPPSR